MSGRVAILFLVLFLMSLLANAYDGKSLTPPSSQVPSELEGVGIDQKLGASIDKSLKFKDENGQEVTLGSFYGTHKPVIISLVYYTCPSLCNFHLNGLTEVLKSVDWNPGQQFEVVAISFDPKETPTDAKSKKESYMSMYNRPGTEAGWHFLTGTQEEIAKITSSVGFNYKWNDKDNQWAHASAAIITTPDGVISRYLGGIQFDPKDVRLALNEASGGKIGNLIDKVILYCFHYDPKANKYALYAFNLMRLGGAVIILVMIIWLLPFWIKTKKNEGTDS
ncbi:MAG: SCO family protein [Bdellovibrionales bacterium]|nr:SCO family protein [Bdellovibrionales bacterium]